MCDEARLRETEIFLHEKIPLTRAMGVRVESFGDGGLVICAPLDANHNHLGTAFGGSLSALVVLAGYGLLWLALDDRKAHVVVRECRVDFRRPVTGEIRAFCARPAEAELAAFLDAFARAGKARIRLEMRIEEAGETRVAASGLYVAMRDSGG